MSGFFVKAGATALRKSELTSTRIVRRWQWFNQFAAYTGIATTRHEGSRRSGCHWFGRGRLSVRLMAKPLAPRTRCCCVLEANPLCVFRPELFRRIFPIYMREAFI